MEGDDTTTKPSSRRKKLPPKLLQAIGAVVVTASVVDQQVSLQVIRMISPVNYVAWHAWPIVSGMDFRVKLSVIRMMAAIEGDDARNYINECCDKLQELYKRRNDVAHSTTNGEADSSGRFSFYNLKPDAKTGLAPDPIKITPDQINDWGRLLFQWANELEQSLSDLGYPMNGPTEASLGVRLPEADREAHRPKSRTARTTRKRSKPPGP